MKRVATEHIIRRREEIVVRKVDPDMKDYLEKEGRITYIPFEYKK